MKNSNFRNLCNKYSVCKNAKYMAIVPFVIVLAAIIVIVAIGANTGSYTDAVGIGIDFEGGTILTVTLGKDILDDNAYKTKGNALKDVIQGVEVDGQHVVVSYMQRQEANDNDKTAIVFRYKNVFKDDAKCDEMNKKIRQAVDDYVDPETSLTDANKITYESIGATDLLSKAGIALAVSIALILVYIMIRFTFTSAIAAVVALLHDVVIMFALTVICRVQINSSYVAAMITIVAYSINNTIVIFDRCRETIKPLKGNKDIDYKGIGDMAVRSSLTRTVYSSLTTMVTIVFLAILGSDTIREFCVPIILGLLAGLFSSINLATPLWAALSISFDKTKEKYAKRNSVSYDKKDDDSDSDIIVGEDGEQTVRVQQVKQAGQQKQKQNVVYKYSKKNTTFKKKK